MTDSILTSNHVAIGLTDGQLVYIDSGKVASGDPTDGSVLDGDKLDIDFTPSNYTPSATPAEADDVDDLAAHLQGIDTALASAGGGGTSGSDDEVLTDDGAGGITSESALTFDGTTLTVGAGASNPLLLKPNQSSTSFTGAGALMTTTGGDTRLLSNADLQFQCDRDSNGSSRFEWYDGGGNLIMDLDESGNLIFDGDVNDDRNADILFGNSAQVRVASNLGGTGSTSTTAPCTIAGYSDDFYAITNGSFIFKLDRDDNGSSEKIQVDNDGSTTIFELLDDPELRLYDASGNDHLALSHDGTDARISTPSGDGDLRLAPDGGSVILEDGVALRLEDADGSAYVALDVPTAVTSYTITLPDAAPSSDSVAVTDSSGDQTWIRNTGYVMHWAGDMSTAGNYLRYRGLMNQSGLSAINSTTEGVIPVSGTIVALAYRSATGDGTTDVKIVVNGTPGAALDFAGATGTITGLSDSVSAGDTVTIEYDAGTAPGDTVIELYIEAT